MTRLPRANLFWFVIVLVMVVLFLQLGQQGSAGETVDFRTFMQKVEAGEVKDVTIRGQQITGTYKNEARFETTGPDLLEPVYNSLLEHGVTPNFEEDEDESWLMTAIVATLPVLFLGGVIVWLMRNVQGANGRALSFGKSRARLQGDGGRRVTFEDVAGIDESKEELQEIVEFLKDPRKFTRLGGRIPKGVLLMGGPGTGKTLLARAVAGEAGVPFFSISGSDFVEMFVGVGASRVRDLFEQAKRQAPCIVFIDEIDAVGRHRGAGLGGGHDEREQTLNQLLVEMDGFEGTEGVIVVAATNRPDVLDPALLRPGRFDRRVSVPSPDVRGREEILRIHTRRNPLDEAVDLGRIAKVTVGFSGADLENLCNEAALLAARRGKAKLDMLDFEEARSKIYLGPERRSLYMPDPVKQKTAYHEAGHAIIAHLLPGHDPVHKITIVPRGRALGVTWTMPDEDQLSQTREQLINNIAMAMGGRAAEEIVFNAITGGARSDIQQATQIARHMVCDLGMSEDLGPVAWDMGNDEVFLGRQMNRVKGYSEHTAKRIDEEVRRILTRAYNAAKGILSTNVHILHKVAATLMERESLDADEFAALVAESVSGSAPEQLVGRSAARRGLIRVRLMGVVNVTPDSFSDGGRLATADAAVAHALQLLDEGADWLDVGGESTRPGAAAVPVDEELRRVVPVVEGIVAARPEAVVSIDTSKAAVAERAIGAGARIVNDVSALGDPAMAAVVARAGSTLILMHRRGMPDTMQQDTRYDDLVGEVETFLRERAAAAEQAGVARADIVIDPGIGFGKAWTDNPRLVASVPRFRRLGYRVLVGASRKAFVGRLTGVEDPADRVFGSVGAALAAAEAGADVIRVHDVRATREALAVYLACRSAE